MATTHFKGDRLIVGRARTINVTLNAGDYMQVAAIESYTQNAVFSTTTPDPAMSSPHGADVYTTDSELWVADTGRHRIATFALSGGAWGGAFGSSGSGNGQFNGPEDLAVATDYTYIADTQNGRIQKFTSSTQTYDSQWSVGGGGRLPMGVALDATNSLIYVAIYISATSGEIRVYNLTGTLQDTWVFTDLAPISVDVSADGLSILIGTANGYAFIYDSSGNFQYNVGIEFLEGTGEVRGMFHVEQTIYLVENTNSRVSKLLKTGRGLCQFGADGTGTLETDSPSGFVQYGNYVYLVDTGNNRVLQLTSPTKTRGIVFKIYEDGRVKMLGAQFDATTTTIGFVPVL